MPKTRVNKYYVGATHIGNAIGDGHNDSHTHDNLEDTIEEAKEILENDTTRRAVIIVQIVRVVRRGRLPIIVEKV